MSLYSLLWIGGARESTEPLIQALKEESGNLTLTEASDGTRALEILADDPRRYLLVVIDEKAAGIDLGALVTGVKQINPAVEMIVLGPHNLSWTDLNLPRNYRPILLDEACGSSSMISCVAKLMDMVEAKEDYAQLSRGIGQTVAMARKSTEALLALLQRQNSVGMMSMRRDGFFSSCNDEAQRLTGYEMAEVAHIQVWVQRLLVDDESIRAHLARIERFWAEKRSKENIPLQIRRKDKKIVTLSMTVLVIPDEMGLPRQLVFLFHDPLENCSAREYSTLLNSRAVGFYSYLPGQGFVRISQGALDLINEAFGLDLKNKDVLGKEISALPIPGSTAETWHRHLEGIVNQAKTQQESLPPLGLIGRRMMEHVMVTRVYTGMDGRYTAFSAISGREDWQSESLVNLSSEMLAEKILGSIPRPFLFLRSERDVSGRIADFSCPAINPAGMQLLDLRHTAHSSLALADVVKDPSAARRIFESASSVADTGREDEFEIWVMRGTDTDETMLVHFWLGKVGDGAAMFFHDVTKMREEEKQLMQYRHLFAHMQEAIIVTDLDGLVIDWNPASERMFGYAKEEMISQPAVILTRDTEGQQLEQNSQEILRTGDIWTGEYEFSRRDGTRGVAFSIFALLKDDNGEAYGTVGIARDLTERRRLDERLAARGRELQEKNLALNTLLRHAETEKVRACEEIALDLSKRVSGRVQRILQEKHKPQVVETQANLLLQDLGGAGEMQVIDKQDPRLKLTEKEREVAQLIRLGKKTDEIAFILEKSPDTIRLQRISIRKKLGLTQRDRNLAAYLKTIDLS